VGPLRRPSPARERPTATRREPSFAETGPLR
jgi:hypothetical protein